MKKNWKRVLAYVLTVVMLLGVIPDTAIVSQAEETVVEETVEKSNTEITEDATTEATTETTIESTTEMEVTTETSKEEDVVDTSMNEEATTQAVTEEQVVSENATEETSITEEAIQENTEVHEENNANDTTESSTEQEAMQPVIMETMANVKSDGLDRAYVIYNDGYWDTGRYRWYVNVSGKKHYVFCLNYGKTMQHGLYYGNLTAGYSGRSAFKKAVALNYFYKTNGNSWNGTKDYGPVQEVIWDWNNSETAQKLTTYVNHAWRLKSLGAGAETYSSKLKEIKKSEATGTSAIKKMIAGMTNDKHIMDISSSYDGATNSFSDTISLKGRAWQYFNNGGFNGGSSDIVVDGVYTTDGKKITNGTCTARLNSSGNLEVSFPKSDEAGYDQATAYTVIMHVNFDYKGADSLNYLLTEDGKQNLTYDADFNTNAYYAIRVYGDVEGQPAKLYINKVDEYDAFVSGCTFRLTGVQGDSLTNTVDFTRTINSPSIYFKIEYSGYYKLVETAVPSHEYKLDTTEHYIYAQPDDSGQLLLYEAGIDAEGNYYGIGVPNGSGLPGIEGPGSIHTGSGTKSFYYKFRNYFTSGNATLTKYANLLTKYENGKFVYEKRTLDDVGFTFFAAENIYLNDELIFTAGTEILSGQGWGLDLGTTGVSKSHVVAIDGKLVYAEGMGNFSKYRGYTANQGTITIRDLPPGSYYCLESDLSHPGLVMTIGRHDFDVIGDQTVIINGSDGILNEQAPADVHVYKQDDTTKEYLSGAEFTLYASIQNTNYDGAALFTAEQTVDVVTSRNLATGKETVVSNTWIPIQTSVSNASGVAVFDNLPYGNYLIAETKAPEGYEIAEKTIQFTHALPDNAKDYSSGFIYTFEFGDVLNSNFTIYKKAEKAYLNTTGEKNTDAYVYKNEAVAGAEFGVYAAEEIKNTLGEVVYKKGDLVKSCTTNADGIASFGGAMFVGKYYYKELKTADDAIYILDNKEYPFEVTGKEKLQNLTEDAIINKQYKGSVKIIKTDGETTVALAGVEFSLLDETQKNVLGTYVTDANGEIHINNLPIGTYYLQETKTQENYIMDDSLRTVTISKEHLDHEISISNDRYKGSIKIIKTDGKTKVPLSDVEFTLFDSNNTELGKYKTDENGEILIDNLDVGTYYLQETKTKKGYKLDDKMVEVVISVDDLHKQVEMENYRSETKITIKTDTTYSGSGQVRTGDMSSVALMWLLFFMSSFGLAYSGKRNNWKVSMKAKKFVLAIVLSAGVVFLGGLTVRATAELKELCDVEYNGKIYTYALQKEYETSDQEEKIAFDEKVNGMKLADVQYETLDTILQKETLKETKDYKDLIVKDEDKIAKTITLDGNVYELQDITWSEVPNMESVSYTVDYGFQTTEPKPDATYQYTYTSPIRKEENTVSLPFVRLEKGQEDWVDGFSATVTFHNIDGLYFNIGNHEITYDANKLSLSESDYKELVKMLGYDTSKYRLNRISWSGKEYKKNNVTCRDAKATGQQYAASYKAYYEDEVENGKIYTAHAIYECEVEVAADEATPTYVMRATAYYEDASVWSNIITFVTEHKAVSIVFVGLILVIIILILVFGLKRYKKVSNQVEDTYTE